MSASAGLAATQYKARPRILPYLITGLAWFAFLLFALRVPLIEPVFLWVLTQGLLVEKVSGGFWSSRGVLLVAYMAAAAVAWWLVERGDGTPSMSGAEPSSPGC